ncbi:MAG: transcription termination factor Rho [Verrucomicrobia bacterium]|nr:transcription termination factor Rho [Verrucomicrobiota bacterium]
MSPPAAPAFDAPATQQPSGRPPGNFEQRPHHDHQNRGGGGGGRFRKWDKRNRWRERNRDNREQRGDPQSQPQNQGEGGEQQQPPPERPLGPPMPSEGILEITPKGYGFLRQRSRHWAQNPQDPWVSPEWIRNLGLREGLFVKGVERMGNRGPQVTEITEVNGLPPDQIRDLPLFEELKAVNPNKRIQMETRPDRLTTRVIDLITPIGRGQRGLIVAPPRAGKTTLLEHLAEAVIQNHPTMHLMLLLVDERPEEVTEFRRVLPNAEIHASSNDSDIRNHIRTACFAIERAKRLVESGQHVFMLLDSITRMGRAFNNAQKSGGAIMSGGVGVGALEMPRRLFAAARNTRDAGSLTIIATTLIETGSRMDELIFQEFKGTGNLELVLDRKIAEQYIYPAVNIFRSGTRREELLLPPFQLDKINMLRRGLAGHKPIDAIQRIVQLMERSTSNTQMLVDLPGKTTSSMG